MVAVALLVVLAVLLAVLLVVLPAAVVAEAEDPFVSDRIIAED